MHNMRTGMDRPGRGEPGRGRTLITVIPTLNAPLLAKLQRVITGMEGEGQEVRLLSLYPQDPAMDRYLVRPLGGRWPRGIGIFLRGLWSFRWKVWTERMMVWASMDRAAAMKATLIELYRNARLLAAEKPDVVYVWNPYCCAFGILGELARAVGYKVRTIELGVLPDTIQLDDGFLHRSAVLARYARVKGGFARQGNEVMLQLRGRSDTRGYVQGQAKLPQQAALLPGEIGILVFGLSDVDAGVIPGWAPERRGPYPYHLNGIALAQAIASRSTRYKVIFKPHPNHNQWPKDVPLAANAWVVNGDARHLLQWCDVVVANGSKMEVEAMLADRPVVNIGKGILSFSEASYRVESWEEVDRVILAAKAREGFEERRAALADLMGYLSENSV